MPISFSCKCGRRYTVPDALVGRELRCPACTETLVVPSTDQENEELVTDFDEVEEERGGVYGLAGDPRPIASHVNDDEPEIVDEEPDVVDEPTDEHAHAPGDPDYFVACSPPGKSTRQAQTFRFYPDRDELLVLHAGPFDWSAVGILSARARAGEKPRDSGPGRGRETDHDELVRKGLARRAAVLDRMTIDELRAEADSDQLSCRLTPESTTLVRIDPPSASVDDRRAREATLARLKFTHARAGKWNLILVTKLDLRMAIRCLRHVLGAENVEVAVRAK
jgi:hypothetical protein